MEDVSSITREHWRNYRRSSCYGAYSLRGPGLAGRQLTVLKGSIQHTVVCDITLRTQCDGYGAETEREGDCRRDREKEAVLSE